MFVGRCDGDLGMSTGVGCVTIKKTCTWSGFQSHVGYARNLNGQDFIFGDAKGGGERIFRHKIIDKVKFRTFIPD